MLAERVQMLLDQVATQFPEAGTTVPAPLTPDAGELRGDPVPLFRAVAIGIGFDASRQLVVLELHERPLDDDEDDDDDDEDDDDERRDRGGRWPASDEEGYLARLYLTAAQARAMATRGSAAVESGRPPCPLCGGPLDPSGHVCPRLNGHGRHDDDVIQPEPRKRPGAGAPGERRDRAAGPDAVVVERHVPGQAGARRRREPGHLQAPQGRTAPVGLPPGHAVRPGGGRPSRVGGPRLGDRPAHDPAGRPGRRRARCSASWTTIPRSTSSRCGSTSVTRSAASPSSTSSSTTPTASRATASGTDSDHVWGIDHGVSFHGAVKLRTVIWDYEGEPIAPADLAALQQLGRPARRRPRPAAHRRCCRPPSVRRSRTGSTGC